MSKGGARGLEYVIGQPQPRHCRCDRPAVFSDDHGMCCKCGHRAAPEPTSADTARAVAWAFAEILNRE